MRLVAGRPDGILEWIAMKLGLAPIPLIDTQMRFTAARAIMAATQHGFFEALKEWTSADEVASRCKTHPLASKHLLNSLVGLEYIEYRDGRYKNTAMAAKWLTADSPNSVVDKMLFHSIEWDWVARIDQFVKDGRAIDIHGSMKPEQWVIYEDAMLSLSKGCSAEVAKKVPLRSGAARMLDIGGSHGHYSKAICDRFNGLRSTILELPDAFENLMKSSKRLRDERLEFREGNILSTDIGEGVYDLVFMSNVAHHLSVEENCRVCAKVQRALKPGGAFVIMEFARAQEPEPGAALGALTDLYFALTSTSGTWSVGEMQGWMRDAGLVPLKPLRLVTLPGFVGVCGRK